MYKTLLLYLQTHIIINTYAMMSRLNIHFRTAVYINKIN